MRIVADENIPLLDEFCGALGRIERINGRHLCREQLLRADVLLVRSVTQVNEALLAGTPVSFVGTATIGTDHIDTDWLAHQGIPFAAAPGCNADSVVQYVLSVLLLYADRQGLDHLDGLSVGVVGAGNVGGTLVNRLETLGLRVLVSDPPRQEAGASLPFAPLNDVLQCDIISLHTPLTTTGPHPTLHLLNGDRLSRLRSEQLLINSGRGAVIDNQALLSRLLQPQAPTVVLDVWENEPTPPVDLIRRCWLATPHIAGYSLEGKSRGTEMITQALCRHLGRPAGVALGDLLPEPAVSAIAFSQTATPLEALRRALLACYNPRDDDARLRRVAALGGSDPKALATGFDTLRRAYPVRREPASLAVHAAGGSAVADLLRRGGLRLVPPL